MITVVTEFLRKSTVRIIAYIYDDDDNLVDPTEVLLDLWDAEGTPLQEETAMTLVDIGVAGIYEHYEYTDADSPAGNWRGVVWAIDGSGMTAKKSEGSFGFKVKV